jgi:Zn-dependent M28 family amino/carboxypeptidase
MRKVITIFALIGVIVAPLAAPAANAQNSKRATANRVSRGNVDSITAAQLKDYLTFIASDELEGRDTPSRGLDAAAKFIAMHLSRWGLKPAGDDGGYFQRIALRRTTIDPAGTRAELGSQRFSFGEDFLAQLNAGEVSGPLIYVGHGWVIRAKNINPYQGLDVKDKMVVVLGGPPKGVTQADLNGKEGEDWESPFSFARRQGAKAIITIPGFGILANWAVNRQNVVDRGAVSVEKFRNLNNPPPRPAITASPKLLAALFQGEKQTATTIFNRSAAGDPVEPFDLNPNKKINLTVAVKTEQVMTQNVVAMLEGGDPALKSEYVALGAHYDHIGVGPAPVGDVIFNGADDDGSGTVAMLAMAEAFARGPRPKRSILFVWHAGEEKGLWGARYFTENPPVPLAQIITQLNMDMIGRAKTAGDTKPANKDLAEQGEIYVIGSKMMSTELGQMSEAVNQSYLNLKFNYRYDDPQDPHRFFFLSDHYHYARKGIPIIFYMDGNHEDYHRPSDQVEKIDFEQMEKVARTVFATAWALANRAQRSRVEKPLPAELMGN